MAFVEDLSAFFNSDDFADEASLSGLSVRGIFDNAYAMANGGLGMSDSAPAFTLQTSQVPSSPVGQLIVIKSVTYAIAMHEPDGTGVSVLILERAA